MDDAMLATEERTVDRSKMRVSDEVAVEIIGMNKWFGEFHVLKNIMIPLVTIIGLEFGSVVAFAVVTEKVFAWPGMGKLIIDSINLLDRPVIVAYLMIIVFMFIIINLVVDVMYSVLDPRVRLQDVKS